MIGKTKLAAAVVALMLPATAAHAGQYCWQEKIGTIVLLGDAIYFTTDQSCPSWCAVPGSWSADARNRAYSMLLTAKTTNRKIGFYWEGATTACQALPVYSSPAQFLDAT
jgi:hypothetical protein